MSHTMSSHTTNSLRELAESGEGMTDVTGDESLGKRCSARYGLPIPVKVSKVFRGRIGPPCEYQLYNISDTGLCLRSQSKVEEGQRLLVELSVNDKSWRGEMVVQHCTQGLGGFKIGLTLGTP